MTETSVTHSEDSGRIEGTLLDDVLPEELAQSNPPQVTGEPEDFAAAFFMKSQQEMRQLLNGMSAKQIRRFSFYSFSYPLSDILLQTAEEKRAAHLLTNMLETKLIMRASMEMKKLEEAEKNKLNEPVNETQETV